MQTFLVLKNRWLSKLWSASIKKTSIKAPTKEITSKNF